MKREEAKAVREENRQHDQSAQQRAGVDWEQARIDLWRQKLKERERAVAARESAVFKREQEYRRLERCPLCGRKGRREDADGRRQVIARRATPRDAVAGTSVDWRLDQGDRPRAGQLIQHALEQGAERAG